MQRLSELSSSLCVISVVSMILYSVLPDESGYKQAFKTLSGLVSTALIITCLVSMFKFKSIDLNFHEYKNAHVMEEYLIEKNTDAYLKDIVKQTKSIFDDYQVKCTKVAVEDEKLVFYINKSISNIDSLTERLYDFLKLKCTVIVGGSDE